MTFPALPALLLATLLAGCAAHPDGAPPQLAAADAGCKLVDTTTVGTMIRHRQCATEISQEERDAIARDVSLRGNPKPIFAPGSSATSRY